MIDQSRIVSADGKIKPVKNLGWILRNWRLVDYFTFTHTPKNPSQDGILCAILKDGRRYETGFAHLSVCRYFLRRPVFFGLMFVVNGRSETICKTHIHYK